MRREMQSFHPVLALGAALAIAMSAPAKSATVDWHLYDSSCAGGAGAVDIACGTYGRFLLLQTSAPPGCIPRAYGVEEDPPAYPPTVIAHPFHTRARRLREVAPTPVPLSGAPAKSLPRLQPVSLLDRWIAVIDFDSAHGDSTTWLAGQVAGSSVPAILAPLDDPALATLGPVGDFHVLARLCEIANIADGGANRAPVTINMSFGRPVRSVDPVSAAACPVPNAACQIAKVVHHLRTDGSYLVAAAGNRGATLFPASLDDVLGAGMLDATALVNGGPIRPAWETPRGADAWIPGNALCLGSWPAPAGSSYSSAMLAGWLVEVLQHPEVLSTLGDGPWVPSWSAQRQCYVLTKGRKTTRWCNAAITTLFDGLAGASESVCWRAATEPAVSAPTPGGPTSPSSLPSLDAWGDPTHPAPESDPCVPCTVNVRTAFVGSDLEIDLSQSGSLPGGIHLDDVSLRVDDHYYDLALTDTELHEMEIGEVATILIHDAGVLIPPGASISLWYRMKENATATCSTSAGCFWSSTPMLLESSK